MEPGAKSRYVRQNLTSTSFALPKLTSQPQRSFELASNDRVRQHVSRRTQIGTGPGQTPPACPSLARHPQAGCPGLRRCCHGEEGAISAYFAAIIMNLMVVHSEYTLPEPQAHRGPRIGQVTAGLRGHSPVLVLD